MKKTNLILGFMLIMLLAMSTSLVADGTEPTGNPRQVSTLNHLLWISTNSSSWGDDFIQTADIDASATSTWNSGAGWTPIGNALEGGTRFSGSYNGQGHIISGLTINRNGYFQGLFGKTTDATIQKLGVTNVSIIGKQHIGGLAGAVSSTVVSECYSTGSVSSNGGAGVSGCIVGGLIGAIYSSSSNVSNCYSRATVSGWRTMGGFAGYVTDATVNNCYSYSTSDLFGGISGKGGLVGVADGTYVISNCFWDNQTGTSHNTFGTGKTTAEMKTLATFTDVTTVGLTTAWDFYSNPYDDVGNDNYWDMDVTGTRNNGYPFLSWEYPTHSLPVTLSTFTAQFIENTPTLYWETQSETDNMGWFVYRGEENDFTTSKKISDFIEGHGTTTQQQSYIYEDRIQNPEVGSTFYYWLESIDYSRMVNHYDKVAVLTIPDNDDPGNGPNAEPVLYGLFQNEPNPFISSTKISFNLHETARVDLNVYNLKGQLVKTLYSGVTSKHTIMWDGKDGNSSSLQAGVYLYALILNGKLEETKKLIIMK